MSFFQRYRAIMWVTFGVLFVVSLGMFNLQYSSLRQQEVGLLIDRFQEHAVSLDYQLKSPTEQFNTIRIEAEHYLNLNPDHQPTSLFMQIKDDPETNVFTLNSLGAPYSPKTVGNLIGTGSINNRQEIYLGCRPVR